MVITTLFTLFHYTFIAPAYVISISDSQTVDEGTTATIEVMAGGIPDDITYQWFKNFVAISGENSSTLTIPNVTTNDVGTYTCSPSNSRGTTNSSTTTLNVRGN